MDHSFFASAWTWFNAVFIQQLDALAILGFVGQGLFMGRFLVQWIASERARRSVIPVAFWFFSMGGGVLLLIYAIERQDPVFITGQGLGLFIYARNLWLIFREKAVHAEQKQAHRAKA